jgi:hypothetical protein
VRCWLSAGNRSNMRHRYKTATWNINRIYSETECKFKKLIHHKGKGRVVPVL